MQIRKELVKPILAHFIIILLRSPDIYEHIYIYIYLYIVIFAVTVHDGHLIRQNSQILMSIKQDKSYYIAHQIST